jgi:hypothetical protein
MSSRPLEQLFPGLVGSNYKVTSPIDPAYNCIAWAACDTHNWWEPDPMGLYYWPSGVLREYSMKAYKAAFETLGYSECGNQQPESGQVKIAIYSIGGIPKHAARQLISGLWASKLGQSEDIEHELVSLSGYFYGNPEVFLRRSHNKTLK